MKYLGIFYFREIRTQIEIGIAIRKSTSLPTEYEVG